MRDKVTVGDQVFFYHSSAKPPGVAGIAEVVKAAYPDKTQFNKKSKYYDAKSNHDDPRWFLVEIAYRSHLGRFVGLPELRESKGLEDMVLLNRSRLSIQPVTAKQWRVITKLGG